MICIKNNFKEAGKPASFFYAHQATNYNGIYSSRRTADYLCAF